MARINRKIRDTLFTALFGSPERKELTLDLYNALNGSHHTNPDDIEINTLEDVIYIDMKNDVSFILQDDLNMYEQQSTCNPNMPLRQFLYAAHSLESYIEVKELSRKMYGSKRVMIPTPKLVTLYNGPAEVEDGVLRLSDSFMNPGEGDIEVIVHLYNIRPGNYLPGKCESLAEYSQFIDACRRNGKGITNETVDDAIEQLPDGVIKRYLRSQKAMVVDMLLTECNVEEVMEELKAQAREDGLEEGRAEGRAEGLQQGLEEGRAEGLNEGIHKGRIQTLATLVNRGVITLQEASEQAGISENDFIEEMQQL